MFGGKKFSADDIPDLQGKVILVTGGNTGLGKQSILAFVKKGAKVYMASRTESKALAAIEDIKKQVPTADVHYLSLNLASLASVSNAAKTFAQKEPRLHVLLNNAGVMAMPYDTTEDGFEVQFGTNHMGHFLLTKLLMPTLEATAAELGEARKGEVRIVNLASIGHNGAFRGVDLEGGVKMEGTNTWERYGVSKLANILHARALAIHHPSILSVSCHPGVIISDLYNTFVGTNAVFKATIAAAKYVTTTLEDGALNQIYLSTMPDVSIKDNGAYFLPVNKRPGFLTESRFARDPELAEKLWDWSESQVKEKGY